MEKVNHYSIDEKEGESSVNYIQAALPPRNNTSGQKNKNIFDLLDDSSIQYYFDNNNKNSGNSAKNPFTHLWGVD